jgi:hypothetical protein
MGNAVDPISLYRAVFIRFAPQATDDRPTALLMREGHAVQSGSIRAIFT